MPRKKSTAFGMRYVILLLLSFGKLHGYSLINLIKELKIPGISPSPGSIYPILKKLEEEGLVTVEKVGRRKYYKLTERGKGYIKAEAELMLTFIMLLEELHKKAIERLSSEKEDAEGIEEVEILITDMITRLRKVLSEIKRSKG
ncbi:MAG TPA: hypothetical protein ENL19_03590 [candidate division WOR-3 bacterium]|uniref:Transcription regulator PadR N-terminal domain-containing protein n=1 Tax=candidate division WOR-3 bacterium TaxID=2052148 RepID=A0A7C5H694_UNCW3|nr:hypothetical protein [candidate division WOR-3 bacterium]